MSDTTNQITFNNTRYHQQHEMSEWCRDHIGSGGWTEQSPKTWECMNGKIWVIHSMFGHTTFAFKDTKHLMAFILRWA